MSIPDSGNHTLGAFARRLTQGTAANVLRQGVNIAGQVLMVPILLRYWGNETYGDWQTLSAFVSYVALLDFGLQTYVANCMNQAYSKGRLLEFQRFHHSALALSLLVSFIAICGLTPILLHWHADPAREMTAIALALQVICTLPLGVLAAGYRATGEYARDVALTTVSRLLQFLLSIAVVIAGGGLASVAIVQLLVVSGLMLFVWTDLRRRHQEVRLGLQHADWRLAFSLIAPSSLFLVMEVAAALSFQGSTLLISSLAGASAVAVFATFRTLTNVIPQATYSVVNTLWPEFTAFEARGEYDRLREIYLLTAKMVLLFALIAVIFLYFAAPAIIRIWTQGQIPYEQTLMTALLLLQLAGAAYLPSATVLSSSNRHRTLAACYLASSITGLSAGYFLYSTFGAAGIIWGMAGAELLCCVLVVPWHACRMLGVSFPRFVADVFGRGLLVAAILSLVMSLVIGTFETTGPIERLLISMTLLSLFAPPLVFFVALDSAERSRIYGFILSRFEPREPVSATD